MTGIYISPIGHILLKAEDNLITYIGFLEEEEAVSYEDNNNDSPVIKRCIDELCEYFSGERASFSVGINNVGTGFRRKTWEELLKIPYGKTITYKELAIAVGNPNAVRAVGGANHHNNISIIVPCHRVIGSNGKLVGYGGQLWRKEWLIEHENKYRDKLMS